jgi:hypothetical protein
MKSWTRSAFLAMAIGLAVLSFLLAADFSVPALAAETVPVDQVTAAIQAAHFTEPLISTSATTPAEDQALLQALVGYQRRSTPDDVSALTAFLSIHPHSGWAPALLTNLGLSYLHSGYFSRAPEAWRAAWVEGKDANDPRAKALVDRAVGELARLYASFGRNDELSALFDEIGERPISGSATENVQFAREELTLSQKKLAQDRKDPRHLFICGPLALQALMMAGGAKLDQVSFLQWYRAGPNGTNLAEVGKLADQAKFAHRVVFRKPDQPVPMPAIVHWKVGHFATVVGEANGRFHVVDPVFAHQDLWNSRAASTRKPAAIS